MVDSSDMQRADWLKYRIRPAFTVYELACLLSRNDPKRVFDAAQADDLSRQATERGITGNGDLERPAYPFDSPEIFRATLLSKPEWLLPAEVCCVLETIQTATGLPMMSPIEAGRAKELAAALELIWPDELDAPSRCAPPVVRPTAPSASAPAASPAEPVRFADLPRVMAEAMHADPMARAGARINLEAELVEMVASGRLKVRDSLTHGPHSYPVGDALKNAVLLPQEVRQLLAERGVSLPAVAVPEPVAAPAEAVAVTPNGVQKREMVKRHAARWPTIETDMKDAGKNGLAAAAKAGQRGWREAAALDWARDRSRLLSAPEPGTLEAVMGGGFPSRRHTLAR